MHVPPLFLHASPIPFPTDIHSMDRITHLQTQIDQLHAYGAVHGGSIAREVDAEADRLEQSLEEELASRERQLQAQGEQVSTRV